MPFRLFLIVVSTLSPTAFAIPGTGIEIPTENVVSLVVDSSYAGEVGDGTESQPYMSLSEAVRRSETELATDRRNVRIRIKPGVGYREAVDIGPIARNAEKPVLSLEAYDEERPPVLYGSEVWTGDTFGKAVSNGSHAVYFHPWNGPLFGEQLDYWAEYGFHLSKALRRRESVRIGDFPLRRVLKYAELQPGSFYVNEAIGESGFGNFFVCPPTGSSMTSNTAFEVAVRSSVININQRSRVILKNLVIQDAADYFEGGLQVSHCRDIKIEGCSFAYCCSYGANITRSSSVALIGNHFYKNGIKGLGGAYVKDLLVRGGDAHLNNWRGASEKMEPWDSAGIKFFQIHQSRFEKIALIGNTGESMGLWLDTDVENVVVSDVVCSRNHYGLFYEASRGPCRLENCRFTDNSIGIYSSAADKLTVENCLIGNNDGEGQFVVFGHSHEGGRTFKNFETERSYRVLGNGFELQKNRIFWNRNSDWKPLISARGVDMEAYRRFQASLSGKDNTFWHPSRKDVFLSGEKEEFLEFDAWKSQTPKAKFDGSAFRPVEGFDDE